MAYYNASRFEWDESKNLNNQRKHGLSFGDVQELFESEQGFLEIYDAAHSELEDRFIAIGEIRRGVVVVVFTERAEESIRIIGARFATKIEQDRYFAYLGQKP